MTQFVAQKLCRATYVNCYVTEPLCSSTKNLNHDLKIVVASIPQKVCSVHLMVLVHILIIVGCSLRHGHNCNILLRIHCNVVENKVMSLMHDRPQLAKLEISLN